MDQKQWCVIFTFVLRKCKHNTEHSLSSNLMKLPSIDNFFNLLPFGIRPNINDFKLPSPSQKLTSRFVLWFDFMSLIYIIIIWKRYRRFIVDGLIIRRLSRIPIFSFNDISHQIANRINCIIGNLSIKIWEIIATLLLSLCCCE